MAKMTAKKLAKMSEEERAAYLEQQRLEEEESKRKKEEMLNRFLKDKLSKEEQSTKLNILKLQEQWRNIMRKAKLEELKKDCQVMRETFERIVDRKDAVIKSLAKDLEEANEQYEVALRSHLQNMEELLSFQKKRISDLENGFQKDLDVLKAEFDKERFATVSHHDQEVKDLHDILYAMELRFNERESEAQQEFQSLVDELKNKNLEETHALSAQRKATLDELWDMFQKETKQYKENTEEKKLRFEALKKKDESNAREIAKQMKRLKKLQDSIGDVKTKLSSNSKETEIRLRAIRNDRETVLAHFRELKAEMIKSRENERSNLTKLTIQSNEAIKELEKQQAMGEKILKLTEMNRKLETEEEKVLPFYSTSLTPEEEMHIAALQDRRDKDGLTGVIHEYAALENFWKRYNKVLLDTTALEQEKRQLEIENEKLRILLKQYLDGISVSEEILSQKNPLLIVSSTERPARLSVPVGDPRILQPNSGNITVVEGAHVAKHLT
ncbi:PREDICTED: coiled-coil domain-containing protein 65-like [Amphimedon queenslandica]|uniref:Dynein regulatory complex subunit 2 n=1 Tax=Amphimedon queenslandica TaxID=400682 RepID=A0A1X7V9X3_AMPQE|nr:PREDICTED: coiled-coil domain-containing protein 65-like [Amphimedon queenslandica]|eukprot:XP_003385231.1 PREDICTED: coiled-coil domain-containing protein 65-like [Amphimedon queenslandica]